MTDLLFEVPLGVCIVVAAVALAACALVICVARARRYRRARRLWTLALFPLLQVAFLLLGYWTVVRYCGADIALLRVCAVLAVLCLGVDAVVLLSISRLRRRARDEARARLLREQLDAYLKDYQLTVEKMEASARMRHDLRNQVQIVNALAERGEFDLAQHHIAAMLRELES